MSSTERLDLVAVDITTGYGSVRDSRVVTRTSFTIRAGDIVAFIGPNGCGKTTLLKTLVGLLPLISGTVTIDGLSPVDYRVRSGIGYLPEGLVLPDAWTGRGMLALAALAGGGNAQAALPRALDTAGIDFDLNQPLLRMSKGMRQRVALAMALLPLPNLLLLDEPEAGLDPAQRIMLRGRLRQFAQEGRIVLLASHDVLGLCTIADRTYLMHEQRLQPLDPAELSDPERLLELFGQRS